uniref:Uncharacterized protein n=1 Tax=Helianthus annuus TaxID=4232 RepID=A0A251U3N0_HELAN
MFFWNFITIDLIKYVLSTTISTPSPLWLLIHVLIISIIVGFLNQNLKICYSFEHKYIIDYSKREV